jgi:hypothetical protein
MLVVAANILRLGWGDLSCPFKASQGLSLREALWSAVAAATAFRLCFISPSRHRQNEKSGSSSYRLPPLLHIAIAPPPEREKR